MRAKWHLVVCGLNHRNTTLSEREPLQIGHDSIARANAVLGGLPGVMESLIVSTCNRVEFYMVVDAAFDPLGIVAEFYRMNSGVDMSGLSSRFYVHKDGDTADHLFRVAAGMDSLVVGESQIAGQLKDAYSSACSVKTAGKLIHRLFHQAFRVGKAVRTDTDMGKGPCSVSSACMRLLQSKIEKVENPVILFVGVNQMISLAADALSKHKPGKIMFANRTPERAAGLVTRFGATAHSLDELPVLLTEADCVIACTSAPDVVIDEAMILRAVSGRLGRKLLIMDMAVPRDVEFDPAKSESVEVLDLDHLKQFVADQQQNALDAIPEAESIIEHKLSEFNYWYSHMLHEPLYNGLGDAFESLRQEELGPLLRNLKPDLKYAIDKASRRLVSRLMQISARVKSVE
jgi:glutamyl-tRNA reductase